MSNAHKHNVSGANRHYRDTKGTGVCIGILCGLCAVVLASCGGYTCFNGVPPDGSPDGNEYVYACASCNDGYRLVGDECDVNVYICTNGEAAIPGTPGGSDGGELCIECSGDFVLDTIDNVCREPMYTCANGSPIGGIPTGDAGFENCDSCDTGYHIENDSITNNPICVASNYTCANGTRADGAPEGSENVERCAMCDDDYTLDDTTMACRRPMYTCNGGTPLDEMLTGNEDMEGCSACIDELVLDGTTMACRPPMYTCNGGKPLDETLEGNEDVENCIECNNGWHDVGVTCVMNMYMCTTGGTDATAQPPGTPGADNLAEFCDDCGGGYHRDGNLCAMNTYECTGGTPNDDGTPGAADGAQFCARCADGRHLDGSLCALNTYVCNTGGTDATAQPPGTPGADNLAEFCDDCGGGYLLLTASSTCARDTDEDGTIDDDDVDDDNDGLIEIHNLDMLHNIRWNLAGTTYDDEEDDGTGNGGDTTGAPDEATTECTTATDSVFLCGYELARSLDFAEADDYANGSITIAWRPTTGDPPAVTNPASATNAGWPGITNFAARFEGNGNTITNLYRRADGNSGLFNSTASGSHVRNVGVVDGAIYGASGSSADRIGLLVGTNSGTITGSYTTGVVDSAGAGNDDYDAGGLAGQSSGAIVASHSNAAVTCGSAGDNLGGLVGINNSSGRITASYATGDINGGGGADSIGGLVGANTGAIVASYATGTINGGGGNEASGGLVGLNNTGSEIYGSYATGRVNGGNDTDSVGGLIGWHIGGTTTASYATGTVDGGSGNTDFIGRFIGFITNDPSTFSYGFGSLRNGENIYPEPRPTGFSGTARTLQIADHTADDYAGDAWNAASSNTLNAWDFGTDCKRLPSATPTTMALKAHTTALCFLPPFPARRHRRRWSAIPPYCPDKGGRVPVIYTAPAPASSAPSVAIRAFFQRVG